MSAHVCINIRGSDPPQDLEEGEPSIIRQCKKSSPRRKCRRKKVAQNQNLYAEPERKICEPKVMAHMGIYG